MARRPCISYLSEPALAAITTAEFYRTAAARCVGIAALVVALGSGFVLAVGIATLPLGATMEMVTPVFVLGVLGLLVGAVLGIAYLVVRIELPLGATSVSVHDGVLRAIGERRTYEVADGEIVRGAVYPGGVVIETRSDELRLPMPRPAANRLLDDVGVGPGRRRYEWRVSEDGGNHLPGFFVAALLALGVLSAVGDQTWGCMGITLGTAVLAPLGVLLTRWWTVSTVVVGFDGIYVSRRLREVRSASPTSRASESVTACRPSRWPMAASGDRDGRR